MPERPLDEPRERERIAPASVLDVFGW